MKIVYSAITLLIAASCSTNAFRNNDRTLMRRSKNKKENVCDPDDFECPLLEKKQGKKIDYDQPAHNFGGHVVIANRAGGTISLVHPDDLTETITYTLPDGGEPLYFAYSHNKSEIWVGDRKNNRIVILKMIGCELVLDGFLPTPDGPFHMIMTQDADTTYPIVYVACDTANTSVAYDATTRRILGKLEPPDVAKDAGLSPHDITSNGSFVFVTYSSGDNPGMVASYDTRSFKIISVIDTLSDPHVAIRDETSLAIAATGGEVTFVTVPDLTPIDTMMDQPSPHGMFISFCSSYLYITSIKEGGKNAVTVYDQEKAMPIKCPDVETDFPTPHNPSSDVEGNKLFITHSGASSTMNSVFDIGNDGCLIPESKRSFETDDNPFGLFVLPPAVSLLHSCWN